MIDVSGLGMRVVVAGNVLYTNLCSKLAELISSPVVKQQDFHFFGWIADRLGGHDRGPHHMQRFVVGGYQHIYSGPIGRVADERQWGAIQRAKSLEIAENQGTESKEFRGQEKQDGDRVPSVDVARTCESIPRLNHAPIAV